MRRKIALVIPSMEVGGAQRVMGRMANFWADQGHAVSMILLNANAGKPFFPIHENIRCYSLGAPRRSPTLVHAVVNNLACVRALREAVRNEAPDVVISFMDFSNVVTLLATRGLRIPVVVCERNNPFMRSRHPAWSWLCRLLYPAADRVVFQTKGPVDYYCRRVTAIVSIIPNPVVVPPVAPWPNDCGGKRPRPKILLAVGRLLRQKGFDLLLEAYAQVAPGQPDWNLHIYGEGNWRGKLESLCVELRLQNRVELKGCTANLLAPMRAADLFVLSSRYEGFPNGLLEAMACGKPVISFDCPNGPREIIRHGIDGLLVPPDDVKALAAALQRLMSGEAERARLGANAVDVRRRFNLEKVMSMWDTVVDRACMDRT